MQLSTGGFGHDIKIADIDKEDGIVDVIVSSMVTESTCCTALRWNIHGCDSV